MVPRGRGSWAAACSVGRPMVEAPLTMMSEQVGDRRFEDARDLDGIRPRRGEAVPPADEDPDDDPAGLRGEAAEVAEVSHGLPGDADLLGQFAITRGQGVAVVTMNVPAGKGDLPGPRVAEFRAADEEEVCLVAIDEESEDGGEALIGNESDLSRLLPPERTPQLRWFDPKGHAFIV